jgi:hypothetical protein
LVFVYSVSSYRSYVMSHRGEAALATSGQQTLDSEFVKQNSHTTSS